MLTVDWSPLSPTSACAPPPRGMVGPHFSVPQAGLRGGGTNVEGLRGIGSVRQGSSLTSRGIGSKTSTMTQSTSGRHRVTQGISGRLGSFDPEPSWLLAHPLGWEVPTHDTHRELETTRRSQIVFQEKPQTTMGNSGAARNACVPEDS